MISKEKILDEIRCTAKNNSGTPLGIVRFRKETGISEYDIYKFWPNFGDAQREAGFEANKLQVSHDDSFIFESVVTLMRELGRFPTSRDLLVKRNSDSHFPSRGSIEARGNKQELVNKISEYGRQKRYIDIVHLCDVVSRNLAAQSAPDDISHEMVGAVYLFKHGNFYKIGKTYDTVRRGQELRIQLPESLNLIHEIKTEDPSGIEAYWHNRFKSKRKNGEWFNLNQADVKAFKCWKRIF